MSKNNRKSTQRQNTRAALGAARFTFTHKGRTYTLPDAQQALNRVPAGVLIDAAAADGGSVEMQLGLALVRAVAQDIDPEAMAALREKNIVDFGRIIGDWMSSAGVAPGESPSSSS